MDKNYSQKTKSSSSTTSIAIIAIVAALALLGVVVATVVTISQEAEARGCPTFSHGINASKGRCFRP
jgi:hypothetical protein